MICPYSSMAASCMPRPMVRRLLPKVSTRRLSSAEARTEYSPTDHMSDAIAWLCSASLTGLMKRAPLGR